MFLLLLVVMFLAGIGYIVNTAYRRRLLLTRSWEDVLGMAEPVDLVGLKSIADCYLQPDTNQLRIQPNEMWEIIGGLKGVNRLKVNAGIMLDLAVFAERWNSEHGPVISEMIRRDVLRLNRSILAVQAALFFRWGFVRAPFHLQEAVSSYYLIRGRLLGLYRVSHMGLLHRLEAAL